MKFVQAGLLVDKIVEYRHFQSGFVVGGLLTIS